MYCEEGKEVAEIAQRLNVPESSVYRWKQDDADKGSDWDKEREAMRLTSFGAYKQTLKIALDKLTKIANGGEVNSKEADALVKIIKSAKSLYKDVDVLGNVLLAMEEWKDFLNARDPETLQKLIPLLVEFGNEMSRKYGKKN